MTAIRVQLPLENTTPRAVNVKDLSLVWRGYTGGLTDAQVRAMFRQRLGYEPDVVWRPYEHMILAGPVRGAHEAQ